MFKTEILPSGDLRITPDHDTLNAIRALAKDLGQDFGTNSTMFDVFESLTANSDYQWVLPIQCGALTDAPILGITSEPRPLPIWKQEDAEPAETGGVGNIVAGSWADSEGQMRLWVEDVVQAWGFMNYAITSPQQEIVDKGYCEFQSGK